MSDKSFGIENNFFQLKNPVVSVSFERIFLSLSHLGTTAKTN